MQSILRNYIYEAIEVEQSGKKVTFKKPSEYAVPEELLARLDAAPELRAAFEALTPGRRKSYIFHVAGAKQVKTRAARACHASSPRPRALPPSSMALPNAAAGCYIVTWDRSTAFQTQTNFRERVFLFLAG